MNKSYLIAGALALGVIAWIASGQFEDPAPTSEGDVAAKETVKPRVRTKTLTATHHSREIVLMGRTEAARKVEIKAQTAGKIATVVSEEGQQVKAGDIILTLDLDDRQARLDEAKALLHQRSLEYEAALELSKKSFRSKTKLAEAKANLNAGRAALKAIELDIEHTAVTAPFNGLLEDRPLEIGDYVTVGQTTATIVDLDPIIVSGSVSETEAGLLKEGMNATAKLIDGRTLDGKIRFVSAAASEATRTFRVELEAENPGASVKEGMTAELRLEAGQTKAHLLSPALLTLSDSGEIGVKAVQDDGSVAFYPANIVAHTPEGIWLGGLPDAITVITVGQEFVAIGRTVEAVSETAAAE